MAKIYKGIGPNWGQMVHESDALDYALSHCDITVEPTLVTEETEEALEVIVDWYFSGNWIPREVEE